MKITKLYLIFLLGCVSIGITSCNNNENTENNTYEQGVEKVKAERTFILPSPLQIVSIFKKAGLVFSNDILNPVDNINKYNTKLNRSLGLGSYSANITYCVVNKQKQDAYQYLKVIKKLTDDLGMSTVFETENFLLRFEQNLSNEDSLISILADLQIELDNYFEDNSEEELAALIFAGAWVESVHFGAFSFNNQINEKVSVRLAEQYIVLTNLIKTIELNKSNENLSELLADLKEIKEVFENFDFISSKSDVENEDNINLNKNEVQKLSEIITLKRNKIINGEY
jgi:hypothetical protein